MFSPLAKKRWRRFKSVKRGYYALITLMIAYILSLFVNFWINDKPLIVSFQGNLMFPVLKYYSEEDLGGEYLTEAQYKDIDKTDRFASGNPEGNYMVFAPIPYGENEASKNLSSNPPTFPDSEHWMGTDDRGRDLLARIVYGFRVSMTFSLMVLLMEIFFGVMIGAIQGFFAGWIDISLQRMIEVLVAIPFLYLVILLADLFGPSFQLLLGLFVLFGWITMSQYIRGEFLRARHKEYVDAARSMGMSTPRILLRHILPNTMTPVITLAPFTVASSISSLSMLDYLGFGVPAPTSSWGEILSQAHGNLTSYHLSIFPILALFLTLLLVNFIGEAIREAYDPRSFFRYRG